MKQTTNNLHNFRHMMIQPMFLPVNNVSELNSDIIKIEIDDFLQKLLISDINIIRKVQADDMLSFEADYNNFKRESLYNKERVKSLAISYKTDEKLIIKYIKTTLIYSLIYDYLSEMYNFKYTTDSYTYIKKLIDDKL